MNPVTLAIVSSPSGETTCALARFHSFSGGGPEPPGFGRLLAPPGEERGPSLLLRLAFLLKRRGLGYDFSEPVPVAARDELPDLGPCFLTRRFS